MYKYVFRVERFLDIAEAIVNRNKYLHWTKLSNRNSIVTLAKFPNHGASACVLWRQRLSQPSHTKYNSYNAHEWPTTTSLDCSQATSFTWLGFVVLTDFSVYGMLVMINLLKTDRLVEAQLYRLHPLRNERSITTLTMNIVMSEA